MDDYCDVKLLLTCGYCGCYLGILEDILQTSKLNEHKCLCNFQNLFIDNTNGRVLGTKNKNIYDSATTSTEVTNNNYCSPIAGCSKEPELANNSCSSIAGCSKEPEPIEKLSAADLDLPIVKETIWTNEVTKLLISTYKEYMVKFESPLYSKKQVWDLISEKLKSKNAFKSGDKCNEKWRNLKKTYEKVLKDKNTTGNSATYWKFFDAMHEIYFKDPHFNPIFTMSTTGTSRKRTCSTSSEDNSDEMVNENDKPQKQNLRHTNKKDTSKDTDNKKSRYTVSEMEERKQQRHEEKIKLKKEMFEWFKENFKKD